jgi:hypothetical protein
MKMRKKVWPTARSVSAMIPTFLTCSSADWNTTQVLSLFLAKRDKIA